jgi:cystathionine gamma-synthase
MERHCANAERVAESCSGTRVSSACLTPAWPSTRATNRRQADARFGGMVSFTVRGGEAAALAVCDAVAIFTLGESLGGVESLIEHPHRMTHASVADSPLQVPDSLLRLSVGIEDVDDLLADLDHALRAVY